MKILCIPLIFFIVECFAQRVIVISGGGARGAWGGGVAESLHKDKKFNYDLAIGTSTGSLLAPFVISKDFEKVKKSYTHIEQSDIFNWNPFKTKEGKEDQINALKAIFRIIIGKKTIGESKNLLKLIKRDIPMDVYEQMLDYEFIVTVVNFSTAETRYFSNQDYDTRKIKCDSDSLTRRELKKCQTKKDSVYYEMINWIWASGNVPLFMSLLKTKIDTMSINNRGDSIPTTKHYWVDGGVRESIALLRGMEHIIKRGDSTKNDTIDVIINNIRYPHMKPIKKPKILKSLFRTIKILNYDTRNNDLRIPGFCDANQRLSDETNLNGNIVVNLYFMNEDTYHTHPNDLLFNNEGMTELWKLGNNFEESAEMERCTIPKDEAKRFVEAGKKPIVHPPNRK